MTQYTITTLFGQLAYSKEMGKLYFSCVCFHYFSGKSHIVLWMNKLETIINSVRSRLDFMKHIADNVIIIHHSLPQHWCHENNAISVMKGITRNSKDTNKLKFK